MKPISHTINEYIELQPRHICKMQKDYLNVYKKDLQRTNYKCFYTQKKRRGTKVDEQILV